MADNEAPLKRNQINLSTTITINYKRPRRRGCNEIQQLNHKSRSLSQKCVCVRVHVCIDSCWLLSASHVVKLATNQSERRFNTLS